MIGLFLAEWRRTVVETVRYPLETISSTMTLLIVFAGLFYGTTYVTHSPIGGGRLTTVVVGYVIWMTMMAATDDVGWSIQNEAQNGTLEQVMLVPWSPAVIFLMRALMAILAFLIPMGIVITALLAITHVHLHWQWLALIPFLAALGTAWGLGLGVAAIALLFKRMGQVLNIIQFGLLFVILAPVVKFHALIWHVVSMVVPFTAQVVLLRNLLSHTPTSHWIWWEAGTNLVLTFTVGVLSFVGASRLARHRGILNHY